MKSARPSAPLLLPPSLNPTGIRLCKGGKLWILSSLEKLHSSQDRQPALALPLHMHWPVKAPMSGSTAAPRPVLTLPSPPSSRISPPLPSPASPPTSATVPPPRRSRKVELKLDSDVSGQRSGNSSGAFDARPLFVALSAHHPLAAAAHGPLALATSGTDVYPVSRRRSLRSGFTSHLVCRACVSAEGNHRCG